MKIKLLESLDVDREEAAGLLATGTRAEVAQVLAPFGQDMKAGTAALTNAISEAMVPAFQSTFWVAALLLVLTLIPALFMPRRREVSHHG